MGLGEVVAVHGDLADDQPEEAGDREGEARMPRHFGVTLASQYRSHQFVGTGGDPLCEGMSVRLGNRADPPVHRSNLFGKRRLDRRRRSRQQAYVQRQTRGEIRGNVAGGPRPYGGRVEVVDAQQQVAPLPDSGRHLGGDAGLVRARDASGRAVTDDVGGHVTAPRSTERDTPVREYHILRNRSKVAGMTPSSSAPLSTTSYAILGLLSLRSWTGYELAQQGKRSLHFVWPKGESVIYEEPRRLVARGLATASQERQDGRLRNRYEITDAGRAELRAWLASPTAGFPIRARAGLTSPLRRPG